MSKKVEETKSLIKGLIRKVEFREYKSVIFGVLFMTCNFYGDDATLLSRGTSICSLCDPFNRKKGKIYSYGRAAKALSTQTDSGEIRGTIKDKWIRRTYTATTYHDISPITEYARKLKIDEEKRAIEFSISQFYPLRIARDFVQFRSQYLPGPINFVDSKHYREGMIEEVIR